MIIAKFDPLQVKEQLLNPIGGYEWSLQRSVDKSKAVGGLGSSANADLGQAVECLLVGFDEPAIQLLEKAQQWVSASLAENEIPKRYLHDERYSLDGEAALRYQTLAMTNWLLNDEHDAESYKRFVEHEDRFLANSRIGKDKVNTSLLLPVYVDAGAFHRALEMFAFSGLTVPKTLLPRNEAQMAYILCRHHLDLEYSQDDVQTATKKFLMKNIDTWLSNGHAVRAAEWLKILFWNDCDRTVPAKQILLKCYDYLPGRTPPN